MIVGFEWGGLKVTQCLDITILGSTVAQSILSKGFPFFQNPTKIFATFPLKVIFTIILKGDKKISVHFAKGLDE